MRIFNAKVFDEIISGTDPTWFSSAELNSAIGAAEVLVIQACTTDVSGDETKLTVHSQSSADNQHWIESEPAEISEQEIESDRSYIGEVNPLGLNLLPHVRFKIKLGGTNGPRCRLKLYVTGRDFGGTE